jgi:hypothetical protein
LRPHQLSRYLDLVGRSRHAATAPMILMRGPHQLRFLVILQGSGRLIAQEGSYSAMTEDDDC